MLSVQEMVSGLKQVLKHPDGVALATSSRMKPIYAALVQMAELSGVSTGANGAAPAEAARASELTKAKSVVDLLIAHSDMPPNASYDDLMKQAHASYQILEAHGGSDCDEHLECLLSPNQLSTASPGAHEPGSSAVSSRADSVRRLSFTPTANLDCSPAHCSPISRFCFDPCDSSTPSALSRHCGFTPSASAMMREGSSPMLSTPQTSPLADTPSAAGTPLGAGSHMMVTSPLARDAHLPPLAPLRVRTRAIHEEPCAAKAAHPAEPGTATAAAAATPAASAVPGMATSGASAASGTGMSGASAATPVAGAASGVAIPRWRAKVREIAGRGRGRGRGK
jgi:hypothetical protein